MTDVQFPDIPTYSHKEVFHKPKMKTEEIKKFAEWLKANQPVLKDDDYWELFAYRIVDYLKV